MSSQIRIGLILAFVVLASVVAVVFSRGTQASDASPLGNVSVTCGPSQQAVVQQPLPGASSAAVNIACVDVAAPAVAYAPQAMAPAPPAYAWPQPAPVPAAYGVAAVPAVAYAPAAPTVHAQPASTSPSAPAVRRTSSRKPSVQKRLLVIGGTAGAGAGLGAFVGGRKGALIGAAIGAGGATVVDQIKHR